MAAPVELPVLGLLREGPLPAESASSHSSVGSPAGLDTLEDFGGTVIIHCEGDPPLMIGPILGKKVTAMEEPLTDATTISGYAICEGKGGGPPSSWHIWPIPATGGPPPYSSNYRTAAFSPAVSP